MRLLFILWTSATALALPPVEEARKVLGAQDAGEREALTIEIWESGREAIPLLTELAKDKEPEVALRADFVLQRLRMGLRPESPNELLELAQAVDEATYDLRAARLGELLKHPHGIMPGLVFLDTWTSDPDLPRDHVLNLAKVIAEALIEQRGYWKKIFTTPLAPRCRGAIIAALATDDLPTKSQMISIFAKNDTRAVYGMASGGPDQLPTQVFIDLARMATISGDIELALEILEHGLKEASEPGIARALAFLETGSGAAPIDYEGKWAVELELFRARARKNFDRVIEISSTLEDRPYLAYESRLLANSLTLNEAGNSGAFTAETSLAAIHRSFATPPGEPDIEALTSSVLIDWPELARTLTLLAHPVEASERLSSEGQITTAIGLLWRSGHRKEARDLGDSRLAGIDEKDHTKVRLTLASLHFEAGEVEKARDYFAPFFDLGLRKEGQRQATYSLALKLFPRKDLIPLASDLTAEQAYQRANAVGYFLPFPSKVSVYWYEYFRTKEPLQLPETLFEKVEQFLSGDPKEARELISKEVAASTKSRLLPTDNLYQQALFLRIPAALAIVEDAAWYQLSTDDLMSIAQDKTWPLASRQQVLSTAIAINPGDPAFQWLDQELNGTVYPVELALHTLGEASFSLQLAALTKKRESLALACELADIKDHLALRCLAILGKSHLGNHQPAEAARFLQTMLCGEIAAGNHPATPIQATLENLADYFRSRKNLSDDDTEKEIWNERLRMIGQN